MTTDITPPPTRDPPYKIPPRRPSLRVRQQWPELSTFAPTPHHRGHLGRSCRCSHPPSTTLHPHGTARVQRRRRRIMLASGAAQGSSRRSVSMHLQFPRDDATRSAIVRRPSRQLRCDMLSPRPRIFNAALELFASMSLLGAALANSQASGLPLPGLFASCSVTRSPANDMVDAWATLLGSSRIIA